LLLASGWAVLVLVAEMFSVRRYAGVAWLCVVGLAAVAFSALTGQTGVTYGRALSIDAFTVFFTVLICVLAIASVFMAIDYLPTTEVSGGEYYPLIMFAVVGAIFMAAATDLIVLFLALETMSMAAYVLAGAWKRDARSNEAALKYFLLGAFASGFMLYGIALLYGASGSTTYSVLAEMARRNPSEPLLLGGVAMLLVGLGFKVAAVPFHLWTPDVYEGAPTSVTAFMATVVKAAAFAALVRVVVVALAPVSQDLFAILWAGAALTMTFGNVVALQQSSLKRMLAYSSIAHTGYLLVGVAAGGADGGAAVLYYLVVYAAMNLGAVGGMMRVARRGNGAEKIGDLAGLGQKNPMLAVAMTVCMLSLTGIPPFGGFFGKLYLFTAALERGYVALVVIAVLNSVLSAAYYLGVVRAMYFESGGLDASSTRPYLAVATAAAVVATILLGLAPNAIIRTAGAAFSGVLLGQ
jgi:NADH-quinone oxidoreductase subunit N